MRRKLQAKPKFYAMVIIIMILCFGISCAVSQHRLVKARSHADALCHDREALNVKIAGLERELEYVRSDEFIIRYARDVLKMVKPGEIRYLAR